MKNQILCIAILIVAGISIAAQKTDKTVEKVRLYYTEIAEKARLCENDDDRGEFGDLFMNELVINKRNHQWRAVGIHQLTYKFFYKGGDSEGHMYPDQLVLVKTERRESNRTYAEEFLYSDAGVLMFYIQSAESDDQVPAERRVYFSGVRTIRIVEDSKTRDRLNIKDTESVKAITEQSRKIIEIFNRSIKL